MAEHAVKTVCCIGKKSFSQPLNSLSLLAILLASYRLQLVDGCGGFFSGSGTIATPYYPSSYPSGIHCVWHLEARNGNVILAQFVSIDIDLNEDRLLIYNGSTLVKSLSGSHLPFNLTLGPRAKLEFITDESVSNAGFQLHWATGISCLAGREFWNGHICVPCTERGNYLSVPMRNCSLDKDAEYVEPGQEVYSPSVHRDVVGDASPAVIDHPEEGYENKTDVVSEAQPCDVFHQGSAHEESTDIWNWLGPVLGVIVIVIIVTIVICLLWKWRKSTASQQCHPCSPYFLL